MVGKIVGQGLVNQADCLKEIFSSLNLSDKGTFDWLTPKVLALWTGRKFSINSGP
jgi:hypothetical protein